jgi:hypothetical protein
MLGRKSSVRGCDEHSFFVFYSALSRFIVSLGSTNAIDAPAASQCLCCALGFSVSSKYALLVSINSENVLARLKVGETPDMLTNQAFDSIKNAMVQVEQICLKLFAPWCDSRRMHSCNCVCAILGHDHRLFVSFLPSDKVLLKLFFSAAYVATSLVPTVVAIKTQDVKHVGYAVFLRGRKSKVCKAYWTLVEVFGDFYERLEVLSRPFFMRCRLVGNGPHDHTWMVLVARNELTNTLFMGVSGIVVESIWCEAARCLSRSKHMSAKCHVDLSPHTFPPNKPDATPRFNPTAAVSLITTIP